MFDLTGKKAIVTGGARGLGRAIAEALHEAGAEVALIDVLDNVTATAQEIGRTGPKVHAVKGDLMDRSGLQAVFDTTVAKLGGDLDIMFNNAGIHARRSAFDLTMDDWDRVIELNLNVVFMLSKMAGQLMVNKGKGKIINTASLLSFIGGFNATVYAASKGGVGQLTKSLANEWAPKGLNVNAIAPGYFLTELNADLNQARIDAITPRIPAGRWGTPDDLKGVAVFLASEASDYINGVIIPIDGGYLGR